MNNALLMRVLNRLGDLDEQLEPLLGGKSVLVAVVGNLDPTHQLHDEVRAAGFACAGVQDFGNVRMVHQRQRLAFGLKASDDLPGVHAQLDDLEGDPAVDRLLLFSHIDHTAAALANLLKEFVSADTLTSFLPGRRSVLLSVRSS